jgi:hypothetical protein
MRLAALCLGASFSVPVAAASSASGPIAVRQREGALHGFLALRTLEGEVLGGGDLVQSVEGDRIVSRLTFRLRDGSVHDESATFSQGRQFRLVSYRLVQRGPAFPHPLELKMDAKGRVEVRYEDDGETKVVSERLDVGPSVANGLVPILLRNLPAAAREVRLPMVAATPKPRLVTLAVETAGEEVSFEVAGTPRKATRYRVKVDIGGISGLLAPIVGKQPPDTHVWISAGPGPAFLKSEGPMFVGGPVWRIELTAPRFPPATPTETARH